MGIRTSGKTGRVNIIKITILLKTIYRFNAMSIKMPVAFFIGLEQIILKFAWKHKILTSQNNLDKEQR